MNEISKKLCSKTEPELIKLLDWVNDRLVEICEREGESISDKRYLYEFMTANIAANLVANTAFCQKDEDRRNLYLKDVERMIKDKLTRRLETEKAVVMCF